jgi:hypothetical protein
VVVPRCTSFVQDAAAEHINAQILGNNGSHDLTLLASLVSHTRA